MFMPYELKGLFTVKDLLERLGKEGFFSNRSSLYGLEKTGIIPQAQRKKIHNVETRVYTTEDIENIISIVKSLPNRKRLSYVK